jgi:hypothetical protein
MPLLGFWPQEERKHGRMLHPRGALRFLAKFFSASRYRRLEKTFKFASVDVVSSVLERVTVVIWRE